MIDEGKSDNTEDQEQSITQGIGALLDGARLHRHMLLEGHRAPTLVPVAHEMRPLLELVQAHATAGNPDLAPDLIEASHYLEEIIYLIDGGFEMRMICIQVENLISVLVDLLQA